MYTEYERFRVWYETPVAHPVNYILHWTVTQRYCLCYSTIKSHFLCYYMMFICAYRIWMQNYTDTVRKRNQYTS